MPEVQPLHRPEAVAAQRACANFLIDLDQCPSGQAPGGYWHALQTPKRGRAASLPMPHP